ncbi:MAG: type II toxin-antitoxin system RelE/ParE family toxin [Pseudomonas sp.]|nr:MAG: type II toxin-antitoxin system RelE/ParE family toxin [Pseudomonas sp.]
MTIYATRWFYRWARKQKLDGAALQEAVREMTAGLFDADLGGHVIKKRVARAGQGKSGGFRTLVATNQGGRWIFLYGFAKNERSNIDKDELEALRRLALELLSLAPSALHTAVRAGELYEVNDDEKDEVSDS